MTRQSRVCRNQSAPPTSRAPQQPRATAVRRRERASRSPSLTSRQAQEGSALQQQQGTRWVTGLQKERQHARLPAPVSAPVSALSFAPASRACLRFAPPQALGLLTHPPSNDARPPAVLHVPPPGQHPAPRRAPQGGLHSRPSMAGGPLTKQGPKSCSWGCSGAAQALLLRCVSASVGVSAGWRASPPRPHASAALSTH